MQINGAEISEFIHSPNARTRAAQSENHTKRQVSLLLVALEAHTEKTFLKLGKPQRF